MGPDQYVVSVLLILQWRRDLLPEFPTLWQHLVHCTKRGSIGEISMPARIGQFLSLAHMYAFGHPTIIKKILVSCLTFVGRSIKESQISSLALKDKHGRQKKNCVCIQRDLF